MKKPYRIVSIVLLGSLLCLQPAMAQKDKEKEKEKNERREVVQKGKALFNKIKSLRNPLGSPSTSQSPSTSPAAGETYDEGETREPKKRKLTPPDVRLQINNARQAYAGDDYAEARFYVQQAIMGIELEIGYQILESMPEMIMGTEADKSQDEVYSTGAGFAGMIVGREYPGNDGNIKAGVGNNSALYTYAGLQASYDARVMYSGDDDSKVIRYKGNKAYIKVDDYDGYEMMVPFGQSSVFVLECSLCETEEELMEVAGLFDIEKYKTLLGEQ